MESAIREVRAVRALEGGRQYKSLVGSFDDYNDAGPVLAAQYWLLRTTYTLGGGGYTAVVYRYEIGEASALVGFAYWRRGREVGPPEYVCAGGTYESKDGEYRPRLGPYLEFSSAYAASATSFAGIEDHVLKLMEEGVLRCTARAYEEEPTGAAQQGTALRLPIVMLVQALAVDLPEHERGLLPEHADPSYLGFLEAYCAGLTEEELVAQWGCLIGRNMQGSYHAGAQSSLTPRCGQKLVPLFMRGATEPYDYTASGWRELQVLAAAGDLLLNAIAPSFALFNQWTFLDGADAALAGSDSDAHAAAYRALIDFHGELLIQAT